MKRLILLSLILTVSAVCVPVFAEDTTVEKVGYSADLIEAASIPNGTRDIENYNGYANFKISSAKGLVMFSHIVNRTIQHEKLPTSSNQSSFSSKTLWLTADIDMSETVFYCVGDDGKYNFDVAAATENVLFATASELFVPIGITTEFRGTFDGQGFTIKNLDVSYATRTGLFCKVSESAQIKNVIIDDTCSFTATASSNATAAAIVGYLAKNASIINCMSMATLSGDILGGIVGEGASATAIISNCTNNSTITADTDAGGIVGIGYASISNCRNTGLIQSTSRAGGIIAKTTGSATIDGCINNGRIECAYNGSAGGIVGAANTIGTVSNCINYGVQARMNSGSSTGYTKGAIIATNGVNYVIPESNLDKTGETDQTLIDQMLTVKAQISVGTTIDSESTSLRLVSSIDSINYKEVYFVISLSDTDISLVDHKENITTVYSTIGETKESALIQRTAYAEFAPQSQFFSTFSITEIGNENFDMTVTAQVFAVDMEGNTICGKQTTFQVSDLIPAA